MSGLLIRNDKVAANEANPNKVPQLLRNRLGNMMNASLRFFRGAVASNRLILPDGAKAAALSNGFIIAGTGGTGPINVVAEDATLGTGEAQIAPNGDIAFFGTDAVTEAEVWYFAYGPDEVVLEVPVASGDADLGGYNATRLVSAEILTVSSGSATGAQTVIARSDTQPASTGQANITLDGATAQFATADNATTARVTFIARPGFGPAADTVAGQMQADGNI